MVWVAGPLSGMIVAPVVGVLADRSTSAYGRRRPYMVAGSVVVAVCLVVLGWAVEITAFWGGESETVRLGLWAGRWRNGYVEFEYGSADLLGVSRMRSRLWLLFLRFMSWISLLMLVSCWWWWWWGLFRGRADETWSAMVV